MLASLILDYSLKYKIKQKCSNSALTSNATNFKILKKKRKGNEKTFNDKLENYNEKFTYAMQSFQATVGTLSNRLNEQTNVVCCLFIFFSLVHIHIVLSFSIVSI